MAGERARNAQAVYDRLGLGPATMADLMAELGLTYWQAYNAKAYIDEVLADLERQPLAYNPSTYEWSLADSFEAARPRIDFLAAHLFTRAASLERYAESCGIAFGRRGEIGRLIRDIRRVREDAEELVAG